METLLSLLPFAAILAMFWFLMIRPNQRRQREHLQMQSALAVGDRVMLTSGIFGTIRSLTDDRARIELSPGAEIEVVRAAIAQVDAPPSVVEPTDTPGEDA